MKPCGLNPEEVGGGESQVLMGPPTMEDCQPLAIVKQQTDQGLVCLSRWQPTDAERAALAAGADVLLYIWGWQVPVALGIVSAESGG